ncbi:MAG: O-antigen ligase family protein [Dehalococcoidia bacterium]|nr:O-antigen ligase family protein [Dehalococcoidia bacterium]
MHHRPDTPQEPSHPPTPVSPLQPNRVGARLSDLANAFLHIQMLWVTMAAALVYLSYILNLSPVLRWIGLALAFLPFPLRLARSGIGSLRTPFDLPIVLLLTGAVVGFCVSDNRTISLGALQCTVAVTLFYYSWVNSSRLANLIKWVIISFALVFIPVFVFSILDVSLINRQLDFTIRGSGTHHGLAMYLAIEVAILLGMAAFDRSKRTKVVAIALCLLFLVIIVVMTWDSLNSLVHGVSVTGRCPIWEKTASLLADSPLTGLGLGCWALARWGTTVLGTDEIGGITHTHNAYLELYSNTGILGALALLVALGIGLILSLDIIRSPRTHPWYGFGVGVILACVATLLVAGVESAPMGVPLVATDTYYYVVSPIAWMLCGLLFMSHRLITKSPG